MKLHLFKRPAGLPNLSPFCVKLETYLRMAAIPYQPVFGFNNKANPKRQMPFVELDGQILADTTLIIDELVRRYGDKVDSRLSAEQRWVAQAVQTMLENHFAKFMVYFRWCHKPSWPQFRAVAFRGSPRWLQMLVAPLLARKVRTTLTREGTGRLNETEMLQLAAKDLAAVSGLLGGQTFFFGDQPALIDAIIFATIGNLILAEIGSPLRELALTYPNLVAHSKRMLQTYFSDI